MRSFSPAILPIKAGRSSRFRDSALRRAGRLTASLVLGVAAAASCTVAAMAKPTTTPDFGPNVHIFTPDMAVSDIQATVDAVAAQQLGNQFGPERVALLFAPGSYGSSAAPLNFQVGYYTAVAGLGRSPTDVVISGSINAYNQCDSTGCVALNNFWRSLSNLDIEVNNPSFGCHTGEFWAVSQAAPMRRVRVNGAATLMDYCSGPSYASGGFIADSEFAGGTVVNGSQQQWLVRDSILDGWTNGVWNQVFSGVVGAPANCFPASGGCGPYTTLPTSPITREAPYLYLDAKGNYAVFAPALRRNSSGTTWSSGPTAGKSIPIAQFFIAKPGDSAQAINRALDSGLNLILTPGVYALDRAIEVRRRNTIVLGLGYPTLVPKNGDLAMRIGDAGGIDITGVLIDAGPRNSLALMEVGSLLSLFRCDPAEPVALHDVFFRIGGATAGSATVSLVVNAHGTILDDIWAWRADHGNGVGWTLNRADTGVLVNGSDVTAYGLFVEHYQKYQTIWTGERGKVVFFQNEMPYDPPSQDAWQANSRTLGFPALKVTDNVHAFNAYGMGSYNFFNKGLDIYASHAFEVPTRLAPGSLQNLLTVFLDPVNGKGGVLNVVDNAGGPATVVNPSTPVTVTSFP